MKLLFNNWVNFSYGIMSVASNHNRLELFLIIANNRFAVSSRLLVNWVSTIILLVIILFLIAAFWLKCTRSFYYGIAGSISARRY